MTKVGVKLALDSKSVISNFRFRGAEEMARFSLKKSSHIERHLYTTKTAL